MGCAALHPCGIPVPVAYLVRSTSFASTGVVVPFAGAVGHGAQPRCAECAGCVVGSWKEPSTAQHTTGNSGETQRYRWVQHAPCAVWSPCTRISPLPLHRVVWFAWAGTAVPQRADVAFAAKTPPSGIGASGIFHATNTTAGNFKRVFEGLPVIFGWCCGVRRILGLVGSRDFPFRRWVTLRIWPSGSRDPAPSAATDIDNNYFRRVFNGVNTFSRGGGCNRGPCLFYSFLPSFIYRYLLFVSLFSSAFAFFPPCCVLSFQRVPSRRLVRVDL